MFAECFIQLSDTGENVKFSQYLSHAVIKTQFSKKEFIFVHMAQGRCFLNIAHDKLYKLLSKSFISLVKNLSTCTQIMFSLRQTKQLAKCGEIANSLAHMFEINIKDIAPKTTKRESFSEAERKLSCIFNFVVQKDTGCASVLSTLIHQ